MERNSVRMPEENIVKIGPYEGELAPAFDSPGWRTACSRLETWLCAGETMHAGRNRLIRCAVGIDQKQYDLVVKVFPPPRCLLRRFRLRNGKARRAWQAARALAAAGIGTPPPVALLESAHRGRLGKSYLITAYVPGISTFRDALKHIYENDFTSAALMPLLQAVADSLRALHRSGWIHYDLGNQNILLPENRVPSSREIMLVDLNRSRPKRPTLRRIARDLSRLCLPSDFRRILHEMYFDSARPDAFRRWERFYRVAFGWHTRTRRWRHPIRQRNADETGPYPPPREIWIWDQPSSQALSAWDVRDRRYLHNPADGMRMLLLALKSAAPLYRAYRTLISKAYLHPVNLAGRIGVSVQMQPQTAGRELRFLSSLGPVPVLLRAYHHEARNGQKQCLAGIRALTDAGHPVTLALVQDRQAVRDPQRWRYFVRELIHAAGHQLQAIEIGHAVNRVKWGFWELKEYRAWCAAVADLQAEVPELPWFGPAAIDFEPQRALAFLNARPPGFRFSAFSHHLYVDRRGAPENKQGRFSTLEKAALLRAMARIAPDCDERLIISEFNWPLKGTGIYSPVCSPYLYPGQEVAVNVGEDDAARYLIRYLLITLCSGMVDRVFWWQLAARGYGLIDDTHRDSWRMRPAYEALRDFLLHLGNATFLDCPPTPPGVQAFRFAAGNHCHWLLYAHPAPRFYTPPVSWHRAWLLPGGPQELPPGDVALTGSPLLLLHTSPAS